MKILITLYLVITIIRSHELERNLQVSYSASTWRSCVESSSQKWCRSTFDSVLGECCSLSDSLGRCSGESQYICSNDKDVDERGGTALCPSDYFDCGTYEIGLNYVGQKITFIQRPLFSSTVWVYKISKISSSVNAAKITFGKLGLLKFYLFSYDYLW